MWGDTVLTFSSIYALGFGIIPSFRVGSGLRKITSSSFLCSLWDVRKFRYLILLKYSLLATYRAKQGTRHHCCTWFFYSGSGTQKILSPPASHRHWAPRKFWSGLPSLLSKYSLFAKRGASGHCSKSLLYMGSRTWKISSFPAIILALGRRRIFVSHSSSTTKSP